LSADGNRALTRIAEASGMIRAAGLAGLCALFSGFATYADDVPAHGLACPPSARYVMPESVRAGSATGSAEVAPADLPGSRVGFTVPPSIKFDLALDPTGHRFPRSELYLGKVAIDRRTGESRIDGQPLADQSPCEAARGRAADTQPGHSTSR